MAGRRSAKGLGFGHETRRRKDGIAHVWVAPRAARAAGFTPRTRSLDHLTDDEARLEACRRYNAEALEWLCGDAERSSRPVFDGTIGSVARLFQTHPLSPYAKKRRATQLFYDRYIRKLQAVAARRIDSVDGLDVQRWYERWSKPKEAGGPTRLREGKGCIQTLRRVVSFAVTLRLKGATDLAAVLAEMRFETPPARHAAFTATHLAAFVPAALEAGRPMMALAVALQFETMLRQKDVIGEWVPATEEGGITRQGLKGITWRSQWALDWTQIDRDLVMRKPTSKSNGKRVAVHDLKLLPTTFALLAAIPREQRIGPVIVDEETGQPYLRERFVRQFRAIADTAGIPAGVWNMDSRAGALTEAREAGVLVDDLMPAATHEERRTTLGYVRNDLPATQRVARARFGDQNKP